MFEIWKKELDKEGYIFPIFMDLSKTFDTLNLCLKNLLIAKVGACGLETDALRYMKGYLTNRKQKVNTTFSEWERITTGMRQGSIRTSTIEHLFKQSIFSFQTLPEVIMRRAIHSTLSEII